MTSMNVKLISQDADLYKLCREILGELSGRERYLSTATVEDCSWDADLYIWDFHAKTGLPEGLDSNLSKHLFLVQRKDLARLHQLVGAAEASILLKPVTRATLSAFLGLAISAHEDRVSAATSLRADRDEILQCLIQANLRLQEYDQDRTNFLARAVHDFRAPLTAISGYCGLLLSESLGPVNEDQKEVLQRMHHSTKRLSRMSSAMFQLSIGRQIKRQPNLRKGDIRECLDQAMHEVAPSADSKRITISDYLEPELRPLFFEPGQIEQVLINLLDNACKFTPKSGEIEIRGYPFFWERRTMRATPPGAERRSHHSREPNAYRIDIRDSGPSVPREHLGHIFEEYTSYGGGQDRSGGGLGLAICRMIISEHGGHVWAENTTNGPVFSFVLPTISADSAEVTATVQAKSSTFSEVL